MDYPHLIHLLEERDIPKALKLVYSYEDPLGLKTVIYEIQKNE
jgi:hypothetical protein